MAANSSGFSTPSRVSVSYTHLAAHILQADRQKYDAPEYIKKNSARFSFEEDENSRSYTEDIDEEGNEKSSEDAEEKAAQEEAMEAVENGPLTE